MMLLVAGGVAVMIATASVAGWLSYREQRARIGGSLIAASRALVFAVDNELDQPLAFVNGLSSSSSFAKADLFQQALGPVLLAALGSFIATGAVIAMAAFFSIYLGRAIAALTDIVRAFPEGTLTTKPVFRLREISVVARSVADAALAVLEARKLADKELHNTQRLNELSTALVGEGSSFQTCLDKIVATAVAVAEANKGNIQLFDPASGSLTIAAQKGFTEDFLNFFGTVRDRDSSSGIAMHEKRQIIVDDVLTSDFVGGSAQRASLLPGVRGVVSTPLIGSKGNLLGMLSTHYARPGHPGERQLRLLNILIRQAADYLERKQSKQTNKTILSELQHRSNNCSRSFNLSPTAALKRAARRWRSRHAYRRWRAPIARS